MLLYTHQEIKTSIPMNNDKYVQHKVTNAKRVGVVGSRFGVIKEFVESRQSQQSIESDIRRIQAEIEVQQVSWQHAEDVTREHPRFHVPLGELL